MVNNKKMYSEIKSSYFGVITEVYRPYGNNLYVYDVNSLYPYVSLEYMPGLICHKINLRGKYPELNDPKDLKVKFKEDGSYIYFFRNKGTGEFEEHILKPE